MAVDYTVIVVYLVGMLAMGWWGMRRASSKSEFLVAGRRLGPAMYSGTMAAIVLGGASTIGGVGLGYQYGLSGAWMVFTIGLGLLALSVFFSARIARLKVYTVSEMLDLRYGGRAGRHLRCRHVGVHPDARRHLDHRVRHDLRRPLRHEPHGRDHPRRLDRRRVLDARRHVVDHPHRHGAVRGEDDRRAAPAAADRRREGGRLQRDEGAAAHRVLRPAGHRRRDDLHLRADLHVRHAHRPGHLAARVHRAQRHGRPGGAARSPAPTASSTPSPVPSSAPRPRSSTRTSATRTTPSRPSSRTNSRSASGAWCWPPPWPR